MTSNEARMKVTRDSERPSSRGPSQTFIGEVTIKPFFGTNEVRNTGAGLVSFRPCARTAWHTHPAGQTLIVTEGTGWIQEWGQPKHRIAPGDVIWTPPGVKHWHGATDSTPMAHITIQDFVEGRIVDWLEHVSDAEYNG